MRLVRMREGAGLRAGTYAKTIANVDSGMVELLLKEANKVRRIHAQNSQWMPVEQSQVGCSQKPPAKSFEGRSEYIVKWTFTLTRYAVAIHSLNRI
jgi:hypothetical protein